MQSLSYQVLGISPPPPIHPLSPSVRLILAHYFFSLLHLSLMVRSLRFKRFNALRIVSTGRFNILAMSFAFKRGSEINNSMILFNIASLLVSSRSCPHNSLKMTQSSVGF